MGGRRAFLTVLSLALCASLIGGIILADSRIRAVGYGDNEPAVSAEMDGQVLHLDLFGQHLSADLTVPMQIVTALSDTASAAVPEIGLLDAFIEVITDCCRSAALPAD